MRSGHDLQGGILLEELAEKCYQVSPCAWMESVIEVIEQNKFGMIRSHHDGQQPQDQECPITHYPGRDVWRTLKIQYQFLAPSQSTFYSLKLSLESNSLHIRTNMSEQLHKAIKLRPAI